MYNGILFQAIKHEKSIVETRNNDLNKLVADNKVAVEDLTKEKEVLAGNHFKLEVEVNKMR